MKQFFPKNTVEAECWCKHCNRKTHWKITDGRPQYCLTCFDRLEQAHEKNKAVEPPAAQEGFKFQ